MDTGDADCRVTTGALRTATETWEKAEPLEPEQVSR
jgi:hypothetical protein